MPGYSSDPDTGALKGRRHRRCDNTNGTWQYTLDGTDWFNIGAVATNNALLLAADATSAFRFVPNANWNGTTGTSQYKAWDQTSGTAGTVRRCQRQRRYHRFLGNIDLRNCWRSAGSMSGRGIPGAWFVSLEGRNHVFGPNETAAERFSRRSNCLWADSAHMQHH